MYGRSVVQEARRIEQDRLEAEKVAKKKVRGPPHVPWLRSATLHGVLKPVHRDSIIYNTQVVISLTP